MPFILGRFGIQCVAMVTKLLSLYCVAHFSRILLQRIKHFWYKLGEIFFFITFDENLVERMMSSLCKF